MYSASLAIVSYTAPMPVMKFVKSEVVRGVESGMIPDIQLKLRKGTNSFSSFNKFYGSAGYETFKKMEAVLRASSLKIRYSSLTKKFTILNSSAINTDELRSIFARSTYEHWQPKVLEAVDQFGNRLVGLTCEASSSLHSELDKCKVDGLCFTYKSEAYSFLNHLSAKWLSPTKTSEECEILFDQVKLAEKRQSAIDLSQIFAENSQLIKDVNWLCDSTLDATNILDSELFRLDQESFNRIFKEFCDRINRGPYTQNQVSGIQI